MRDESNPEGDIEIVYTGLRPAEKLYEELLIGTNVTGTKHPMIRQAAEPRLSWQHVRSLLDEILAAIEALDYEKAYALLMQTATERLPKSGLQDLVWLRAQQFAAARGNVASLEEHRQRADPEQARTVGGGHRGAEQPVARPERQPQQQRARPDQQGSRSWLRSRS